MVLKKAVIDEQEKNNELQQSIKSNNQNIRRLEQEVESLMFRNQQLTKRVGVLQNELDFKEQNSMGKRGKLSLVSNKDGSTSSSPYPNGQQDIDLSTNLVNELNLELKCKTEESELLRQLNIDLEAQRLQQVGQLEIELKIANENIKKHQQEKDQKISELNSSLIKVENKKLELENKYQLMGNKFQETSNTMEHLLVFLIYFLNYQFKLIFFSRKFENKNLKLRLTQLELLIGSEKQKVPEMKNGPLLSLNNKYQTSSIPNKIYEDIQKRQDVIKQFASKLSEFLCALSNLHSHISQKILVLFALCNKNLNHLYFLDFSNCCASTNNSNPGSPTVTSTTTIDSLSNQFNNDNTNNNNSSNCIDTEQSSIISQHRSLSVMSILRKV